MKPPAARRARFSALLPNESGTESRRLLYTYSATSSPYDLRHLHVVASPACIRFPRLLVTPPSAISVTCSTALTPTERVRKLFLLLCRLRSRARMSTVVWESAEEVDFERVHSLPLDDVRLVNDLLYILWWRETGAQLPARSEMCCRLTCETSKYDPRSSFAFSVVARKTQVAAQSSGSMFIS